MKKRWGCDEGDNPLAIRKVEVPGFIGLLFETYKVSETEIITPIRYLVHLTNGDIIELEKQLKLFRLHLKIKNVLREIIIYPETGFVKGKTKGRMLEEGYYFSMLQPRKKAH